MRAAPIVLLGGLLGAGVASAARAEDAKRYTFESDPEGSPPRGWATGMTGRWRPTEWSVRRVDGNNVLAHVGFWSEDPDGIFPLCWVGDARAKDVTLRVRLFPVPPPAGIEKAVHDGAGIVVRLADPDNYYLLRAVPHESRVRLYKVQDGKRTTLAGKDVAIPVGRWLDLALEARGDTFTAFLNGERLFAFRDDTFKEAGAFGLWSKPNNVTLFDDLEAIPR